MIEHLEGLAPLLAPSLEPPTDDLLVFLEAPLLPPLLPGFDASSFAFLGELIVYYGSYFRVQNYSCHVFFRYLEESEPLALNLGEGLLQQ